MAEQPLGQSSEERHTLDDLLRVMQRLRDPDKGCPWDLAQDFDTITPATLEEAYELVDAIEQGDFDHIAEESGDLLFQVIFYAQMASERNLYDFGDVVHTLTAKLVRRHPHVFADGDIEGEVEGELSVERVKEMWEAIKEEERREQDSSSALADVPAALPSLSRSQKLQRRAAGVGFDWSGPEGVLDKLREEIAEFEQVAGQSVGQGAEDSEQRREEELGDILFTCVNLARHGGIDAETALRRAAGRFEARFRHMEAAAEGQGTSLESLSPDEREALWERAKQAGVGTDVETDVEKRNRE